MSTEEIQSFRGISTDDLKRIYLDTLSEVVKPCADTHQIKIIGLTLADCDAYFRTANVLGANWGTAIAIVLRSPHRARGWIGPVFATPAIREHSRYAQLLEEARPMGSYCTCFADDPERVA